MSATDTKFAHWNSFPFMTRKTSEQQQSRLFRLPRELRDLVYEHYVFEEEGLLYDPNLARMFCRSSTSSVRTNPQSGLERTCRKAAEELKGVAWKTNTIHFETLCSLDDGAEFRGVRSKAGRLKCRQFSPNAICKTLDCSLTMICDSTVLHSDAEGSHARLRFRALADRRLRRSRISLSECQPLLRRSSPVHYRSSRRFFASEQNMRLGRCRRRRSVRGRPPVLIGQGEA